MNPVTIGGVTIGLAVLVWQLTTWWPGLKSFKKNPLGHVATLGPFLIAWAYGVLAVLTVGGLIGWAAGSWLWINNWLGDASLVWGVGGQAGQVATATVYLPLTQTGGALVLLMTIALLVAVKKSRYGGDIKRGAWAGICLGTSAGVAGLAAVPLAQATNWAGATVYGVFV